MEENGVTKKVWNVVEAGRKGGNTCKERHGIEFFSQIAKVGGATTRDKHGKGFYSAIGKLGGTETSKRHGPDFYADLGRKGGERMRSLIAKAKALEAQENE